MGDIYLGDLDLLGLEDACKNNTLHAIAPKQIQLLNDILNSAKNHARLGIITGIPRETKNSVKEVKKRGEKQTFK